MVFLERELHGKCYSYSDTYTYTDPNSYANTDTHADTEAHCDASPVPYSDACGVSGYQSGPLQWSAGYDGRCKRDGIPL